MSANPKAVVLTVLSRHIGQGNGISMRGLEQQLDMLPRQIRHHISDLREEGHAICGTPRDGYFVAATAEEWAATRQFAVSRAMHSLRWISRVEKIALPDLLGQLHVPT